MQETLASFLNFLGLAWWVEIKTESPRCTYYFGPFSDGKEAEVSKSGYIEDLQQEEAQGISVAIKRCKPTKLTISDDMGEISSQRLAGTLSGQLQ